MKIYMTGFMGVGKTKIGKEVASQLNLPFIDLDEYIEQKENRSIPQIFEEDGEDEFRKLEKTALQSCARSSTTEVVALGGGTMCHLQNHQTILSSGVTVYLYKPWEDLESQINGLNNRPLIAQNDIQTLEALYYSRQPFYRLSQLTTPINTTFTPKKLVNLLKLLTNR